MHFYNHQPTGSNTKEVAGTQGFPFLIHLYVFIYYNNWFYFFMDSPQ